MKEFIKKHIDKILIITGVVVAVGGNVIAWALNLPRTYSLYAAILLLFTIGFLVAGLLLFSDKLRKTKPRLRMAIRYIAVFFGLIMTFVAIAWLVGGIIDLILVSNGG